jgi:hypothetical protein
MMHACTVAYGQVVVIDSGSPFSPSQTAMHTSVWCHRRHGS